MRTIEPGEELTYDYQIERDAEDPPNIDKIFACRCGAPDCRGTMLWPSPEKKKPQAAQGARQGRRSARKKPPVQARCQEDGDAARAHAQPR